MKLTLLFLLSLLTLTSAAQKSHVIKPNSLGHININNTAGLYKPGDSLLITGNPKSVIITGVSGDAGKKVFISNVPGETLTIGDSLWSSGSYSWALMFKSCRYIEIANNKSGKFSIIGSKSTRLDANGFPVRGSYFDLRIDELSDNFKVHDINIRHGGTGVWAKTEVTSDPRTWAPNTLNNFEFYNLDISDTYVEGMYIGHTGTWWNIKTNQPYYTGTPTDMATYKQPAKLKNVSIINNRITRSGYDGIQTAAIDGLRVIGNEVIDWAVNKNSGHNGGLLVGGRVKGFIVLDNRIHDGWGEMMQVYAEGGDTAVIQNNLFAYNKSDAVVIRGTNNLAVMFENNTVLAPGGTTFRVNGYYGGTAKNTVRRNIFAQPTSIGGVIYPNRYIYLENGGTASDEDNQKFSTVSEIGLTAKYEPLLTSRAFGYGYRSVTIPEPPAPLAKITITSNELAAVLKALKPGTYSFEIGVDSVVKKVSVKVE